MKFTLRLAVPVAFVVVAVSPPLEAQWPAHPTSGIPKTSAGKPDLNGRAPRTADGKPDFTGIWENFRRAGPEGEIVNGVRRAVNAGFLEQTPPSLIGLFRDIGTGVPGGLPLQPWAADLVKQRVAENSKDNPDAHCLPIGLMQLHTHPDPRKIIQTGKLIVVLYESNSGVRQIFMDGRSLPKGDPQPWWYGYSVGRWEGDTLVVETSGLRDGGWLDVNGNPLTDAAKLTERIRRPSFGTLSIDVTVDDPKAYTRPWTVNITQKILLDHELIEFICGENERDVQHLVGK